VLRKAVGVSYWKERKKRRSFTGKFRTQGGEPIEGKIWARQSTRRKGEDKRISPFKLEEAMPKQEGEKSRRRKQKALVNLVPEEKGGGKVLLLAYSYGVLQRDPVFQRKRGKGTQGGPRGTRAGLAVGWRESAPINPSGGMWKRGHDAGPLSPKEKKRGTKVLKRTLVLWLP